jgi:hypothetical protein
MWPCIVTNFLIIKPIRCTNFSNLFWNETLHVSDSSTVHHQELFNVHSAVVYVIQVCRQLSSCSSRFELQFHPDPAAARKLYVWHTPLLSTVNNSWWWTEELSETCRVSFQNKLEKLVHLFGFIIRKLVLTIYVFCSVCDTDVLDLQRNVHYIAVCRRRYIHGYLFKCYRISTSRNFDTNSFSDAIFRISEHIKVQCINGFTFISKLIIKSLHAVIVKGN